MKIFPFFHIKLKTRAYINILRHGSLQMNVLNMPLKLEVCTVNIKRYILGHKKSEKIGFKCSYPVIIVL